MCGFDMQGYRVMPELFSFCAISTQTNSLIANPIVVFKSPCIYWRYFRILFEISSPSKVYRTNQLMEDSAKLSRYAHIATRQQVNVIRTSHNKNCQRATNRSKSEVFSWQLKGRFILYIKVLREYDVCRERKYLQRSLS